MPLTIFVGFPSGRAASSDLYTYIGGSQSFRLDWIITGITAS